MLRRTLDQGVLSQSALVFVDGALVGPWYKAGGNTVKRFRQEDFEIPASFTSGKTAITVKIQFVSSQSDWNEFAYTILTLTP